MSAPHRRVTDVFLAAAELAVDERAAFLERVCGEDAVLRAEVEGMLAADGASFLSGSPLADLEPESAPSPLREQLARLAALTSPAPRYRVEGEVARGGMGVVLRVSDEALRRTLAMKVLPPEEDGGPGSLRRFLSEAEITARLDHPGVVPVHELGVDRERRVYFTMKLVEGETLARVLGRVRAGEEGWSVTRALRLLLRVCDALGFAHSRGVVHRDLKPDNVMVGRFGEVYVMDWGVARVLGERDERDLRPDDAGAPGDEDAGLRTRDGHVVGTPCYMAPEQAFGDAALVGPAADVYALGAILYELLAGERPYQGGESALETVAAVRRAPPEPLSARAPAAPPELVSICERAMARRIEERYPDMADLGADLEAYLEDRVVRAHATGPVVEARKWVRRNRALASSLAAALVIALGASIFVAWQQNRAARAIAVERNLARESEALAREERDNLLRVSDVRRVRALLEETDALWPARVERVADMEDWLARARELLARKPRHEETLAMLRERIDSGQPAGAAGGAASWGWWHDTLSDLMEGLDELSGDDPRGRNVASVEARILLADDLPWYTVEEYRDEWDEAIAAIAGDPRYGGLVVEPQVGLVPLGSDPDSGLQEFWHWQSGARPERDGVTGALELSPADALVLVLLPGGTFTMGSSPGQADAAGFVLDPAKRLEEAAHEVTVGPFFLSKYELTQAQWERSTGDNPSYWTAEQGIGAAAPMHPVDQVSWEDCARYLPRLDLAFPTEAQWEYAVRGGTTTVWWTGSDVESLQGAANIADRTFLAAFPEVAFTERALRDGHAFTAPVGSLRPNPFGLHDMLGNVWEWCADVYAVYEVVADRAPPEDGPPHRILRGGCFDTPAWNARSAARSRSLPINRHVNLGVRPARVLR